MQVVEKKHRINATITGLGAELIKELILKQYPKAKVENDFEATDEFVRWEDTDLYKELLVDMTPGDNLRAYRERAGLSITELAKKAEINYTNISAMENNRRVIGLSVAKKLAKVLNCHFTDLLPE